MANYTNPEPEPLLSVGVSQSGGSSQLPRVETAAGLSTQEAARRLQQYGPNVVAEERRHPWLTVRSLFWAPVPWMLELAIVLELVLGKLVEAGIIAVLLLLNGAVSAVQEHRAQGALTLLRQRLTILARVQRDGQWQTVPASELVPGDIMYLRVGDVIPADVRLAAGQLFVDQSALTGESLPAELEPGSIAYAGTAVKRGEATGEATATGASTFFGKTAELVRTAKTASHLERIILQIVQYLVGLDTLLLVAVLGYAFVMHISLAEILPFTLVLLIASVPVALPATFTLTTSLGAQELARSGILVTRLSAIEEAAGMDVLCSDKTGTMTQNQLAVDAQRAYPPTTSDDLLQLASLACDEATQDPIDLAILQAARERNLLPADAQRLGFVPFDPGTKRSEATVQKDGQVLRIVKGAPRVIADLAGTSWTSIAADVEALAARGFRILAVAAGAGDALQLIGLVALTDPPRPDSRQLVQSLQDLGVRVLMVTGDSEATARTVATEVGIGTRSCSPAALRENPETAVATCDIFAGVFPEDKIHLVQALQRSGHVVGMTGDGVNDAPALKQAEVGIAVACATDVAKAAASLVLTSAGLGNMVAAVELSRRIYQRMLTYTLNMSIKKIAIPLFLSLGLLISGVFVTNARLMVLMLFANDFVTMSITTDRVSLVRKPQHWATRSLIMAAFSLALPLLLLDFGVFWVGHSFIQLALPQVQTFVFVWLVLSGQLTVYLVREQHHFWRSRPSRWLLISSIADVVIVSLMATQGWLMAAIPMSLVAALLFLGLIYLVGADFLKVRIFHRFQIR